MKSTKNKRYKENSAALYIGSYLTVHNFVLFFGQIL